MAWGRFTGPPTNRNFEAIAREGQPLAQAISDYRSDHGLLPENINDLVPAYLPKWPEDWYYSGGNLNLYHRSGLPHTYVSCGFDNSTNQWRLIGEYAHDRTINIPGPVAKISSAPSDTLFATRLAELEKRITNNSRETSAYHDKISFAALSGSNALAVAECERAIGIFPNWWMPQLARAELRTNDLKAEQDFKAWVQAHPTFINYWYLSRLYRDRDNYEAALAALAQGTNAAFTPQAIQVKQWQHEIQLAVKGLPSKPISDDTDDAFWIPDGFALDAVRFCCENRKYELALKIIQHCSVDDLGLKATAELGMGQFDTAIEDAQKAARVNPDSDFVFQKPQFLEVAHAGNTNFYFLDRDNEGSEWTLFSMPGEIASANNNRATADTLYRASQRGRAGDFDAAIADCTKVLQQNPRHVEAYNLRAWNEFLKNDFDAAIKDSTRAIQLNLNYGNAYGTRGWAHFGKGETNEASNDLKAAIAICGESSLEAIEDQGLLEFINGHHQNAIASWQNAIQKNPSLQRELQPWIEKVRQRGGQ